MSQLDNDTTWISLKNMIVTKDAGGLHAALDRMSGEWGYSLDQMKEILNKKDANGMTLRDYATIPSIKKILHK